MKPRYECLFIVYSQVSKGWKLSAFDVFFYWWGKMWPLVLLCVVSDSHKGYSWKSSTYQFERIPLILTYTPRHTHGLPVNLLKSPYLLKLSRQGSTPLRFETCPHPSSRPPAEIPVTSSCPSYGPPPLGTAFSMPTCHPWLTFPCGCGHSL